MADPDPSNQDCPGDSRHLAAFEELIREHQRMIHSLCYRMTGSLAEAEDLAQDTFVQAYRHLEGFRAESSLSSWLYRIAMNRCLNWHKHRVRETRAHQEWGEQQTLSPEHATHRAQQVEEALLKLPAKQRAAVVLTTYEGLSHAEAAAALGCSETTISWRLFAARAKLKRLLRHVHQPRGDS